MVVFRYRGGEYRLYFNGLLLYAFYDRYGREGGQVERMEQEGKDGLEVNVWLLCELTRQATLYRRFLGEETGEGEVLAYSRTLVAVTPAEIPEIRNAVALAVAEGFRREHLSAEEQDPWLQEIEAQKHAKKARPGRSIRAWSQRLWASLSKRG